MQTTENVVGGQGGERAEWEKGRYSSAGWIDDVLMVMAQGIHLEQI